MRPGILVALEGIDGAGKTTQARALREVFEALGMRVISTKEPTDGPHGRAIRDSAQSGRRSPEEELQLFLDDRAEHVRDLIGPELQRGSLVLVDRYYLSTVAYQGIRGFDPDTLLAKNEAFAPRPDLIVLLDLPVEVGLSRVQRRGEGVDLFEAVEDLRRSREIFNALEGPELLRLDATGPPEPLTPRIVAALLEGPLQQRVSVDLQPLAASVDLQSDAWRSRASEALARRR